MMMMIHDDNDHDDASGLAGASNMLPPTPSQRGGVGTEISCEIMARTSIRESFATFGDFPSGSAESVVPQPGGPP